MNENTKKYLKISLTLGVVAASSALLISLTNLATRQQIAQNEVERTNNGLIAIFGEGAKSTHEEDMSGYKYVNHCWTVSDANDKNLGFAYRTSGSNSYGKVTLIVGFSEETHDFKGLQVIVNEQTYASTLVDKYINPLNEDGISKIDDVECGATYGAKLVRDMVNEAKSAVDEIWKD